MPNIQDEQVNFTLRLSKDVRDKLAVLSSAKNSSINSYIQNVLDVHLIEAGLCGASLISLSGRSFSVQFDYDKSTFDLAGYFSLCELRFNSKTRARYRFGLSEELGDDWGIKKENAQEAIKELGLAMLAAYNKKYEIDKLAWYKDAVRPENDFHRLLFQEDIGDIASLQQFLDSLAKNKWQDEYAQETEQSQDIRLGRRTEQNLYR